MTWGLIGGILTIIYVNFILSGDNAVVIAMAVRSLPAKQRQWGIVLGASGAVIIRLVSTVVVAQLLVMPYVKLVGGLVILWIGVKLLTKEDSREHRARKEAAALWQAVWIISVADISMGIDNMLAVGAASHGNMFLLLFGLALSIPFVVFMSNMLSTLMDRYPITLWIGAAILGRVAGEMVITDPWVEGFLHPPTWLEYGVEALGIILVCGLAKLIRIRRSKRVPVSAAAHASPPPEERTSVRRESANGCSSPELPGLFDRRDNP